MSLFRPDPEDELDPEGIEEELGSELAPEEREEFEEELRAAERRYFRVSRSLSASLLFALPLIAIYELGVLAAHAEINAAAAWVKTPISWLRQQPIQILGGNTTVVLNAVVIVAVLIAVWRLGRLGALHAGTFGGMLLESCVYAMAIGPLALLPLTGRLEFAGFAANTDNFMAKVVLSCGAGFYEELVFRFILLGLVFFLARELMELRPVVAGILALALSGAVFSAAHFLGAGEDPNLGTFIYRLAAGMVLGFIFLTRGFGVAAWTHALYDVYALCLAPT